MKQTHAFAAVLGFFTCFLTAYAQNPSAPTVTETIAFAIPGIVAAGARVEVLKQGLRATEGPVATPEGDLLFTETTAHRIWRLDSRGDFTVFMENVDRVNGLAFDADGRLLGALGTEVAILLPTRAVLANRAEELPVMRPNDLVADTKGGVYFTDAPPDPAKGSLPRERAVYYIDPSGRAKQVAKEIEYPNGVGLSPDGNVLYVANTRGPAVLAFDVTADGSLRNRRDFGVVRGFVRTADGIRGGGDGIAVDAEGRVYVATYGGVEVFNRAGEHLGVIPVGIKDGPRNLAFAGTGKKTLYIVGQGAVWKVAMEAQGIANRAK